jgi:hypothetical protein
MVRPPFMIPAAPRPETALPIMNIFEEMETAHISEPSSNRNKKDVKIVYR